MSGDFYRVYCCPDVKPQSLAEIRRYLQKPIKLHMLKTDEFDRRLQENYEQGSNEAMQMADELGEEPLTIDNGDGFPVVLAASPGLHRKIQQP